MPGAEHRPGQVRPIGQPNFQQFGERSAAGTTGTPRLGSGERRGSGQQGSAVMHPLAIELVKLMEQEQQRVLRRGSTEFYPPFWMYDKISWIGINYSRSYREWVQSDEVKKGFQKIGLNSDDAIIRPELSDQELEERQQFFNGIQKAYGIAAYAQFTPHQKDVFREELRRNIRNLNIGNVTLNEQQRVVLQHIAAATNTPVDPNQETYHYYTVLQQPDITKEEMMNDPRYGTW